jgi:hypothetical protein
MFQHRKIAASFAFVCAVHMFLFPARYDHDTDVRLSASKFSAQHARLAISLARLSRGTAGASYDEIRRRDLIWSCSSLERASIHRGATKLTKSGVEIVTVLRP